MRILIVTVTTGGGHNASADALAAQFREMDINEVVVADMYEYCSALLYTALDRGYLFTTHYLPKQFGGTYNRLDAHARFRRFVGMLSGSSYMARKFLKYFTSFKPDAIIATHVFAATVLNVLKNKGLLNVPVIGVVTDYCIHPYWSECSSIDNLVTASEFINHSAHKKGINAEMVLPYGIPVNPNFARNTLDKQEAREKLGLDLDMRTLLVMGGSMGYGKMLPTVLELLAMDENQQIICICGNNKKLYASLTALNHPSLHVKGYVRNVNEYMDAADCIITKPGGLTTTEILVKRLPAIIINPIPGPEERNMQFLLNNGCAIAVTKNFSVAEAVYNMFLNPERIRLMEEAIKLVAKPDAAERICKFTIGLVKKSVLI